MPNGLEISPTKVRELSAVNTSKVTETETQPSRLMPSPKALQKALKQSAKQAQRMADAFGLVVPSIKPKQANSSRNAG